MKLLAFALLSLAAAPAFAGECLLSPPTAPEPGMSVVAPEMQRKAAVDVLCVSTGDALARIRAPQAGATDANGYVKQTEFDNSPWRFNMSQDGRRMTAEEFEAWMKSKGIHVAKGRPAEAAAEAPPPPPPPGG
jgi:hypothetical protein